jgi:hypothetical protein
MIKMGMMQSGLGNSFSSNQLIMNSNDALCCALVRFIGLEIWIEGFMGKVMSRAKGVLDVLQHKSIFVRVK